MKKALPLEANNRLSLANCPPRILMTALYLFANFVNYAVVGTGNKAEDFGIPKKVSEIE